MKMKQFNVLVDQKGKVKSSDFTPMIDIGDSIGDVLPIYSYLESFRKSEPFLIEGYDFKINDINYIVDTKIIFEDPHYMISLIDRTAHYQKRILNQTSLNKVKIEKEYKEIKYGILKVDSNYLKKVSDCLKVAVAHTLSDIKNNFNQLSDYSKKIIENDAELSLFVNNLHVKLQQLESKLLLTSKINKINPLELFEHPKRLTLKRKIDEVIDQSDLTCINIQNKTSDQISIFCNEDYGKNVVSYFLDPDKIHRYQDVEIESLVSETGVVKVQFNYIEEEQEPNQHHTDMQQILLPANEGVLRDSELMHSIIQNLSDIYVQEINACMTSE